MTYDGFAIPDVGAVAVAWDVPRSLPRRGTIDEVEVEWKHEPGSQRMRMRWLRAGGWALLVGRPSRRRARDRGGERERELRARLAGALA